MQLSLSQSSLNLHPNSTAFIDSFLSSALNNRIYKDINARFFNKPN